MKVDKAKGAVFMAFGTGIFFRSLAIGASTAPETIGTSAMAPALGMKLGVATFAYGLQRFFGNSKQSVYDDMKNIILPPEAALATMEN